MSYKSLNGLMKHLRDNGITISGSKQKHQLINTGYFMVTRDIDFLTKLIRKFRIRTIQIYMPQLNMIQI